MTDKNFLDENNLDDLLNRTFLDGSSDEVSEHAARFILQQEYNVKIDATKEKQLLEKLNNRSKRGGGYLNLLIIIFLAAIGGALFLTYSGFFDVTPRVSESRNNPVHENEPARNSGPKQIPLEHIPITRKTTDSISSQAEIIDEKQILKRNPAFSAIDASVYYPQSGVGSRTAATFFKPSEQDFIFYERVKKEMLQKLISQDKEMYSAIESGEIKYRGKAMIIHPFTFCNHAITNLEYKIFLSELIKTGKSEEFKQAAVKNENWLNYNFNILASTYFFDERYNDFPVVNISPTAAVLYSNWLEKELNQFLRNVNPQTEPLKIQLPSDTEWILAIQSGHAQVADCDGYSGIYDIREGIVDKGYLKRTELIRIQQNSKRTELDELFSVNRYGLDENQVIQLFKKGFDHKSKLASDSLYPGNTMVFSKAAPVAEMMREEKTGKTVIAGCCWKNKKEYTKMLNEFNALTASPFVGFRVVIVAGKNENL